MPQLPIVIAPDVRLKTRAKPVEDFDASLRRLADDMLETMYAAPGIGLAANQVGVLKRLAVVDVAKLEEPANPLRLVNPEVVWASGDMIVTEEGCLSLPELFGDVTRPNAVRVRYQDVTGESREIAAEGLLAVCIQHEIDHLNGVLFIDHLSALKRNIILRKLQKAKKLAAEG